MIIKKNIRVIILTLFTFAIINELHAQSLRCQVLNEKISQEYYGNCKDGLANGNGKAKGDDVYIGTFKNGLPDGKGKYIFNNGDIYEGYWKDGKKDGKGKFTFKINGKKQILTGYWKNDEYAGVADPDISYNVISSLGIPEFKVEEKLITYENGNQVLFSIKSAFTDFSPSDLVIKNSSGQIFQHGKKFGIHNHFYPLRIEVSYTILIMQARKQCHFIIDLFKAGRFEITLNND
jgi:hypothetical protein